MKYMHHDGIVKINILGLDRICYGATAFNIKTLGIMGLFATLSINDTPCWMSLFWVSQWLKCYAGVVMLNVVKLRNVILSVIILGVVMLNVVMLSVMRPMLYCVKHISFLIKIIIALVPSLITDAHFRCSTPPRKQKTKLKRINTKAYWLSIRRWIKKVL